MEKYSRGRRGAPAKGIGRVTGARVQIPPSPFGRELSESQQNAMLELSRSHVDAVNKHEVRIYKSTPGAIAKW